MNYLFVSNTGECLPIASRLKKEGHGVAVYIHNRKFQSNYDGMLDKLTMNQLLGETRKADLVIFDMNKPVESKSDRALLKMFGAKGGGDHGVFGPVADAIRSTGKTVLGCSRDTERLELDRNLGAKVAGRCGLDIPKSERFTSLQQGRRFLGGRKDRWAFKPCDNQDLDLTYVERFAGELLGKMTVQFPKRLSAKAEYILQEVIEGVELSTEAWWTGKRWTCMNHTAEDKCFMTGDLGPRVGSMNNTVWLKKKRGLMADVFERLTPIVQKAKYVGPWDINCIVSARDRRPYFLEHTPRLGYDAIYCLLTLCVGSMSGFFEYVSGLSSSKPRFKAGYASSVRLSVPPYPYEDDKLLEAVAKDVIVDGDLTGLWLEDVYSNGKNIMCAGSDGVVGVVTGRAQTIDGSVKDVYQKAEKVKIASYPQYRTDAGKRAKQATEKLKAWGVAVD